MGKTCPAVEYVPDGFLVPLDEGAEQRLSQAADFKGLPARFGNKKDPPRLSPSAVLLPSDASLFSAPPRLFLRFRSRRFRRS